MYVVMNRVMVKDDWKEELFNRFRNRKGQIDKQPGFVKMQVLDPEQQGSPCVVLTIWENKHYFEQWIKSEDFKIAHQNPMPKQAFTTGGGLESYQVVISNEKE